MHTTHHKIIPLGFSLLPANGGAGIALSLQYELNTYVHTYRYNKYRYH